MRFLAPILALVAASAAVASVTHARHPGDGGRNLELIASVKKGFGVKGVAVKGLYPGATRPLSVTITNTYGFPIKVSVPRAKVAAATNRAGCTGVGANLQVAVPGVRTTPLRAHKHKVVTLQVTMPKTVANACQGATFTIAISARATRG